MEHKITSIDRIMALEVTGGDRNLAAMLLQTCVEESPKIIDQVVEAIAIGDFETARRCGHSLKSSFAAVGAQDASEKSCVLENLVSNSAAEFHDTLSSIKCAFEKLETEAENFWASEPD